MFSLESNGLLDKLTFQGGTSLRLCYNADRFSEDLNFVGGHDFSTSDLMGIKDCLEKYIGKRYELEITIKEPKDTIKDSHHKDIKVAKWQIKITTEPERKDLPKQKIKLEVANVPAYTRIPRALKQNYSFLPDGYSDIIVMTESLDKIMADKIVSLVSCQKYIRHRDIWDLRWLKQQGATINAKYILAKISVYKEKDYPAKLNSTIEQLENIVHSKEFMNEMSHFLPIDVQERTIQKNKFIDFLINENKSMLAEVKIIIERQ